MTVHAKEQDQASKNNVDSKRSWQSTLARFGRRNGLQIGIFCVLLAIWLLFIIGAPTTFLSSEIYAAYMSTIPFFAIIALPLTLVVIAGEMDLSFPSIMAVSMVIFIAVFKLTNSVVLALLAALVTGFLVGLSNGLYCGQARYPLAGSYHWHPVFLARNGTGCYRW